MIKKLMIEHRRDELFHILSLLTVFFLISCIFDAADGGPVPAPGSDAIVLLAGDHHERAPVAAALYKAGYAPMVLLTNDGVLGGWSGKYGRNLSLVEWTEEKMVSLGVPRARIVKLPFHGSATMQDAFAVKRYVLEHGLKKIVIVTSDYHLRRAMWTFRKAFHGSPVGLSGYTAASGSTGAWRRTIMENMKFLYYLIRYGLVG